MTQQVYWRDQRRHLVVGRVYNKRSKTLALQDYLVLREMAEQQLERLKVAENSTEQELNNLKLLLWKLEGHCNVEIVG